MDGTYFCWLWSTLCQQTLTLSASAAEQQRLQAASQLHMYKLILHVQDRPHAWAWVYTYKQMYACNRTSVTCTSPEDTFYGTRASVFSPCDHGQTALNLSAQIGCRTNP